MTHSRRSFLRGVAGVSAGAAALARPFFKNEAIAQSAGQAPLRLVIVQTPDGRPPGTWVPSGGTQDFVMGPAFQPFESLRNDLNVISGLDIRRGEGEPHCAAFTQWMTGQEGRTNNNYTAAQGPSFDQILAREESIVQGSRFDSLQLAGDMTTISIDVSHRYMSWGHGVDQPLPGEHRPDAIYRQLFGNFTPTQTDTAALDAVIRRRTSVLDLIAGDWQRLERSIPQAQKENYQAHLDGIRSLETDLQDFIQRADQQGMACATPDASDTAGVTGSDTDFERRYPLNLRMMRMALACDMSRIVTFVSSPSTSNLRPRDWLPQVTSDELHHWMTHDSDEANLLHVGRWYSEQMATFIQDLKNTPEGAGNLLDNTLVYYGSEQGYGNSHNPTNVPVVLFGNAQGQLETGRYLNFLNNRRSTNDLWISIARLFGLNWNSFGPANKYDGPLPGIA